MNKNIIKFDKKRKTTVIENKSINNPIINNNIYLKELEEVKNKIIENENIIKQQNIENRISNYSKLKEWIKDHTLIDLYNNSNCKILPSKQPDVSLVLVEAFIYIPPPESSNTVILSEDSYLPDMQQNFSFKQFGKLTATQKLGLLTLPFVKIIATQDDAKSDIKPGDIYAVKDKLAYIRHNPESEEYYLKLASNPSLKDKIGTPPPRFLMGWNDWDIYRYRIDKFNLEPSIPEEMTFLIPDNFLIAKYYE